MEAEPPLILPNMEGQNPGTVVLDIAGMTVITMPVCLDPRGEAYARVCRHWAREYAKGQRLQKAACAAEKGRGGKADKI